MFNEANLGGIGKEDVPEGQGVFANESSTFYNRILISFLSETIIDSTIGTTRPRCKTDLSRSHMHNEQTLVQPCGVMIGHTAFYNAEAVSNVLVSYLTHHRCRSSLIILQILIEWAMSVP